MEQIAGVIIFYLVVVGVSIPLARYAYKHTREQ